MKLRKLTALCLSFGLLCACGSSRDVPEITPQQSYRAAEEASAQAHTAEVFQSAPASVSYPLTDTSTVLTLSYPLNNDFDLAGDQQFLAAWEKTTGVTIDAEAVPGAEYYANLNQRIAADELSDIYLHLPDYLLNADVDVAQELGSLLSEYASNYISAVNSLPNAVHAVTEADGRICRMAILMDQPSVYADFGLMLRQDWMDALDLSSPETYEELHHVLLSMKDAYQPAQPLRLLNTGFTDYNNLCSGYGISLGSTAPNNGFYQVDGEIHYGPLEAGFTDYLTMLHQWYQEGVITPAFLDAADPTANSYLGDISTGDCGAFFLPLDAYTTLSNMCSFLLAPAMDPVSASGDMTHLAPAPATIVWGPGYSVSTACTEPALAVQMLDWLYSEEAQLLGGYGTEGESYTIENGSPAFTDLILQNPQSLTPPEALGAYTSPSLSGVRPKEAVLLLYETRALLNVWTCQKDAAYMLPQGLTLTQEDAETYSGLAADFSTYVDSVIPQLITGEISLDEIPAIQQSIRDMGADDCIALWQAELDRWNALGA